MGERALTAGRGNSAAADAAEITAALALARQSVVPDGAPFPLLSLGDVLIYGAIMAQMASAAKPANNLGEGPDRIGAWAEEFTAAMRMGRSEDAAGHTYTYNAQHRIATADSNAIQYVYNAFGQRVEKSVGGVAKYYLYNPAGQAVTVLDQNGNWLRGEIFAGGRHIATYVNNTTDFDYSDWLGTERLTATLSGTEQDACTSLPYGDDFACSGPGGDPSPLHFTGQEHDNETGLDHFPARNYTATWARWMVPDWSPAPTAVPYANFVNPQSLDLYLYASDNPVTRTDAGGHCPVCVLEELETLAESVGTGAATGSATGAEVGAAAGTLVEPGGGTAAGGVGGGVIGGIAGAAAGAVGYVIYRLSHVAKPGNPAVPVMQQGEIGPSGKPMIHNRPSPTRKRAADAARRAGKGNPPIEHSNPRKGLPHFHPTRKNGEKIQGCHYNYPCR